MKLKQLYALLVALAALSFVFVSCEDDEKIAVTSVTLNKPTLSLVAGTTETLVAGVVPDNAANKTISWSSNSTTIATVNSNGLVSAVAEGAATITVTTDDGGKTATCVVTVTTGEVSVTGVTVAPRTLSLVVADVDTLTATVSPPEATNPAVTWSSNATGIVSVDAQNGEVTAIAEGAATVTAITTDGSFKDSCIVTVSTGEIPVTGVTLSRADTTLTEGDSFTLVADIAPEGATNTDVTWSSNSTTIATVDNDGLVTAVAEGAATITVITDDGGFKDSCIVTVSAEIILVESITIDVDQIGSIPRFVDGQKKTLTVTVLPETASNKDVTWSSEDTDIATVDAETGEVTAVAPGNTTITATATDGSNVSGDLDISVSSVKVVGVTVTPSTYILDAVGDTTTLRVTITPTGASNKRITWSSNATSIATVDATTGLVTGVSAGSATITATSQDIDALSSSCVVHVAPVRVIDISIVPTSHELDINETITLAAIFNPGNATFRNVTWSSNATGIATVNATTGLVTGLVPGTATITVTTEDGNKTATSEITVKEAAIPVNSISLNHSTADLVVNKSNNTIQLEVTFDPSNADNKNIAWTSSNTATATVVDGLVTAVKAGMNAPAVATITATAAGGATATCEVTVTKAVMGISLSAPPATLNIDQSSTFTANLTDWDATNRNVTWNSSDPLIATVEDAIDYSGFQQGKVTAIAAGTTTISVTTEDGGFTASHTLTVIDPNAPVVFDLGTVSFKSATTWSPGTWSESAQTWSDVVTATGCKKDTYNGKPSTDYVADCRQNTGYGDMFSWEAVNQFGDQLCPGDWRVPTLEDFYNLDIAMGGTGATQTNADLRDKYVADWNLTYGGYCNYNTMGSVVQVLQAGARGYYWTSSEYTSTQGNSFVVQSSGSVQHTFSVKEWGLQVRCVK